MNCTDRAYLAGYVDGEACVGVYGHNPLLVISSCFLPTLRCIAAEYDVNVLSYPPRACQSKDVHVIRITKVDTVRRMLMDLLPYLREKRQEAVVMLRYLAYRRIALTSSRRKRSQFDLCVDKHFEDKLKAMKQQ